MSIVKAARQAKKMGVTREDFMAVLAVYGVEGLESKAKRKRRTRAEIEAANAEVAVTDGPNAVSETPKKRVRKSRKASK